MATTYSYACKEFPGMEACPAHFHAETEGVLWKVIELHALYQLAVIGTHFTARWYYSPTEKTLLNGRRKTSPNSRP